MDKTSVLAKRVLLIEIKSVKDLGLLFILDSLFYNMWLICLSVHLSIQIVFWFVMSCSVVVGYQHFRGPRCLHLQGEVTCIGKFGKVIGQECKWVADGTNQ